ncbi:hypothetical protein [Actinomadura logoneensis]|nr:hypothetical protein [Actinomadura logoneensis]
MAWPPSRPKAGWVALPPKAGWAAMPPTPTAAVRAVVESHRVIFIQ